MAAIGDYLILLAATLCLEIPIACALAPRNRRSPVALTALFLNLVTHPLATWLMWRGVGFPAMEAIVVVLEFVGYRTVVDLRVPRAALIALLANVVTIFASYVLTMAL